MPHDVWLTEPFTYYLHKPWTNQFLGHENGKQLQVTTTESKETNPSTDLICLAQQVQVGAAAPPSPAPPSPLPLPPPPFASYGSGLLNDFKNTPGKRVSMELITMRLLYTLEISIRKKHYV